ncbi:MAG: FkbM family methyltransferase [Thiogranum sp.]|nr:FkbM family methyltransferase [Thiogranum sp.]
MNLLYREKIGFSTLLKGVFERNELEYVQSILRPGDLAIDVGANIGIYTVAMGLAVQEGGHVWAFEPLPDNVVRLKQNLLANRVEQVDVCEMALSDSDRPVNLYLAGDSAYPSTVAVREGYADGKQLLVESGRLDKHWQDAGEPVVRLIKIDVEGAEPKVLRGAEQCLRKCRPLLLLEANEAEDLEEIKSLLEPLGYEGSQPEGFHGWNWLFRVPA